MGLQRIGYDCETFTFTLSIYYNWYTQQHFDIPWVSLPFAIVNSRRIYGDPAQFKCGFPLKSFNLLIHMINFYPWSEWAYPAHKIVLKIK